MGYYLLLYHGDQLPDDADRRKEAIASWERWTREISNSVVDGGSPIAKAKCVTKERADKANESDLTAYTIVEADSLDEAVELSRSAPALYQGGKADVYRIFDSPAFA